MKKNKMEKDAKSEIGAGRLPGESTRAYRAYCRYRDFGPDRSLDSAWRRYCEGVGEHTAKRRPGQWATWSRKYDWVDRAEAYDDLVEEEDRAALVEGRKQMKASRARFEQEDQSRKESQVKSIDMLIDRMVVAPLTEVTQVKVEESTSKKTITKIKAVNGREVAALIKVRYELARQIVEGYTVNGVEKGELEVERIVWASAKDVKIA